MQASRLVRRRPNAAQTDLCSAFCSLYIAARGLNTTAVHRAAAGSNNDSPNPMSSAPPGTTKRSEAKQRVQASTRIDADPTITRASALRTPASLKMTPQERAARSAEKAKEAWKQQQANLEKQARQQGSLASSSIFADELDQPDDVVTPSGTSVKPLARETAHRPTHRVLRIDPRPNARLRWARMMVIRDIRHRGRISREMRLARTERTHTSRSRFFKTSIKKLAPLARQIAGKPIDDAIMQMRFSVKKAAREVHKHLVQARNEAIVMKGMGLSTVNTEPEVVQAEHTPTTSIRDVIKAAVEGQTLPEASESTEVATTIAQTKTQSTPDQDRAGSEISDPSITAPLPTQMPSKVLKGHTQAAPTDMYIAEAWVNRGKFGFASSPRARGRQDKLRIPHTGISVLLKEEKTRTREKAEKEIKAIRKRMNGKIWTQLPDRPVTRQSQYVLW